jgi:23S rRNA (uracil1939-C5)-methyltransferase
MKKRGTKRAQGLKPPHFAADSGRVNSCPDTRPLPKKGETAQIVQIEKPIYGGAFLARLEGKALFVPLVLPGEQARVRAVDDKRSYATGEAEEIVATSPHRLTPACRHFGACGGCDYQHAEYAAQLEFKKTILRETLERGGVRAPSEIDVLAAAPWAYRNRIRVAFDAQGNPGYRGRRSHAVIPIAECPIAAPLLVRAALAAGEIARETNPPMRLTEIGLVCDADESALLAEVVGAGSGAKAAFEDFARALAERVPELNGAELAVAESGGQALRKVVEWGAKSISYPAAGFEYRVDQGAFFQVNRWLAGELVECATGGEQGELAWDLFAGVGLFARRLTESFVQVVAVESAPPAMEALRHNLRGRRATAVKAATLEFLRRARGTQRPDLVVVDPPRAGLGAETTALLGEVGAPALTYVSCDPATLARDLRTLIASGYAIARLTLADLFPQTFHLETVVQLRR